MFDVYSRRMLKFQVEVGFRTSPHYGHSTRYDTFDIDAETPDHARSYAIDRAYAKHEGCAHVRVLSVRQI